MKMKKEDRDIFKTDILGGCGKCVYRWRYLQFCGAGGIPDDRIFRYLDHFIPAVRRADRIFHDTAEYTGGNIVLSSAGKTLFFSSLRCMLISSLMIDYVAPLFPVYSGDRLLAALCTGVFAGLGYAVIYMQNSSTGGSDFIIMAVKNLKPYWSVGKISFVTDVIIILLGGFLLRDVDGIIYGMIVSFLLAIVVDKLMYGINSGKMTLVVTEHGKEICDVIDSCCGRGSTILQGQGGYRCDNKQIVILRVQQQRDVSAAACHQGGRPGILYDYIRVQ